MHLRSCPLLVCLTLVWAPLSIISSQCLFILRDLQNLPCRAYKQSVWDTGKHCAMRQQAHCAAGKATLAALMSSPGIPPGPCCRTEFYVHTQPCQKARPATTSHPIIRQEIAVPRKAYARIDPKFLKKCL